MYKITIIALFLLFHSAVFASKDVCPKDSKPQWDKMSESDFTIEKANLALNELLKHLNNKLGVEEEFVLQLNRVILGTFLRQQIEIGKNNPEYLIYAKQRFCDFMENEAFLVH